MGHSYLILAGNESSVEKLLKQISSFMSDIADDFKIVVVEAIRCACMQLAGQRRMKAGRHGLYERNVLHWAAYVSVHNGIMLLYVYVAV